MLLTEQELRAALEPTLDRLLAERLRFFQLESEPRLKSLIESAVKAALGEQTRRGAGAWSEGLLQLRQPGPPRQCFATLLELARGVLEGGTIGGLALYVIRDGEATLWGSEGIEPPARFALDREDIVGAAVERVAAQARHPLRQDAGLPTWCAARAAGAHPIVVGRRAVGVLYWEAARSPDGAAWQCLETAAAVAGWSLWTQALA